MSANCVGLMQQILHTSLQRSNIAVGKIGGQSAKELHNILFKHCHHNVHVRSSHIAGPAM